MPPPRPAASARALAAGWRGDGVDCQDVDECAEGTASCDQICIMLESKKRP